VTDRVYPGAMRRENAHNIWKSDRRGRAVAGWTSAKDHEKGGVPLRASGGEKGQGKAFIGSEESAGALIFLAGGRWRTAERGDSRAVEMALRREPAARRSQGAGGEASFAPQFGNIGGGGYKRMGKEAKSLAGAAFSRLRTGRSERK